MVQLAVIWGFVFFVQEKGSISLNHAKGHSVKPAWEEGKIGLGVVLFFLKCALHQHILKLVQ